MACVWTPEQRAALSRKLRALRRLNPEIWAGAIARGVKTRRRNGNMPKSQYTPEERRERARLATERWHDRRYGAASRREVWAQIKLAATSRLDRIANLAKLESRLNYLLARVDWTPAEQDEAARLRVSIKAMADQAKVTGPDPLAVLWHVPNGPYVPVLTDPRFRRTEEQARTDRDALAASGWARSELTDVWAHRSGVSI